MDKLNRTLYISEHLLLDSHVGEFIEGIQNNSFQTICIDYKKEYLLLGKNGFEEKIEKVIQDNAINLIVVGLGDSRVLDVEFLCKLSNKLEIKICMIFSDSEHMFESHDRYYAQAADICWVGTEAAGSLFKTYGYKVFEKHGFSKKFRNYLPVEKKYDVSFIGGYDRSDRIDYLNYLASNGINVFVAGSGSKIGRVTNKEKDKLIQLKYHK